MKFIHTSDWHLGRDFFGFDLSCYQDEFLSSILAQIRAHCPDALLISGDVLDKTNPRDEELDRLADFLNEARQLTHVVLISGNHDGASRLGFARQFTLPEVSIITHASQVGQAVEIRNKQGELSALVYPIPYLYPYQDRAELSYWSDAAGEVHPDSALLGETDFAATDSASSTQGAGKPPTGEQTVPGQSSSPPSTRKPLLEGKSSVLFAAALRRIGRDLLARGKTVPVVGMAHDFLSADAPGEDSPSLGTLAAIPTNLLQTLGGSVQPGEGLDYLALGHIHGAFPVSKTLPVAWYSGSPLPYRVTESNEKCTLLIEIDDNHQVNVERLPLDLPYRVAEITGSIEELTDPEKGTFDKFKDTFVKVTLREDYLPPNALNRLRAVFPRLVKLDFDLGAGTDSKATPPSEAVSDLDLAKKFLQAVGASPEAMSLLDKLYEESSLEE